MARKTLNGFKHLSLNKLPSAVLNVPHRNVQGSVGTEAAWARRLVADGEIKSANLIHAPVAHRVKDVVQLVVLRDVAAGLVEAGGDEVHAVSSQQRHLPTVQQVGALARGNVLVLHGEAAALAGVLGGGDAEAEVVPRVVGDVEGSAGGVDLEEVQGAALVAHADADVVAVDGAGPVGDAVGVDLAADDAD